MDTKATEDAVWLACQKLEADNKKLSASNVLEITGGSKSTVLPFIRTYQTLGRKSLLGASEVPDDVLALIVRALALSTLKSSEKLTLQLDEANSREVEAVEALANVESQVATMEIQLAATRKDLAEALFLKEQQAAVDAETIAGIREQIVTLKQENIQLNRDGEADRSGIRIAQLKLEHAENISTKSLNEVSVMKKQLSEMSNAKIEMEKELAVSACNTRNLMVQIGTLEKKLAETEINAGKLEAKTTELARQLKSARSLVDAANAVITQLRNCTSRTNKGVLTEKTLDQSALIATGTVVPLTATKREDHTPTTKRYASSGKPLGPKVSAQIVGNNQHLVSAVLKDVVLRATTNQGSDFIATELHSDPVSEISIVPDEPDAVVLAYEDETSGSFDHIAEDVSEQESSQCLEQTVTVNLIQSDPEITDEAIAFYEPKNIGVPEDVSAVEYREVELTDADGLANI